MDIVVKGRHIEVPDHFRQHVTDKLSRVERLDSRVMRLDVEIWHEPNPRQSASAQRVEITCRTKGPVVRAEASAVDFYSAVDTALSRLEARLRKAADRRRVHHGHRTPVSVAAATAALASMSPNGAPPDYAAPATPEPDTVDDQDRPFVVREKTHRAEPMELDQALLEMELVGHDFFLFHDAVSGLPSVVYRRRGYDYGVIRLAR